VSNDHATPPKPSKLLKSIPLADAPFVRICGPSRGQCKCACPDSCEHDFSGHEEHEDGLGASAVCAHCGMSAMTHDLWTLP